MCAWITETPQHRDSKRIATRLLYASQTVQLRWWMVKQINLPRKYRYLNRKTINFQFLQDNGNKREVWDGDKYRRVQTDSTVKHLYNGGNYRETWIPIYNCGEQKIEHIDQFKYLGRLLTNEGYTTEEIRVTYRNAQDSIHQSLLTRKLNLELSKNLVKNYISNVWIINMDIEKSEKKYLESVAEEFNK